MLQTLKGMIADLIKLLSNIESKVLERPPMCSGHCCDNPTCRATLLQCRQKRREEETVRQMRARDVAKLKRKDPNVVPILLQRHERTRVRPNFVSLKLLVHKDISLWQLRKMVRRRLGVPDKRSLYLFTSQESITAMGTACLTTKVGDLSKTDQSSDGFLHIFFHWQ